MRNRTSADRARPTAPAAVIGTLLAVVLFGCSYHGALRSPPLPDTQIPNAKTETTLILSNRMDGLSDIVFTVSAVTFNYDVKDAYLNASRATLESVYGPVDVGSEMGPTSKLFAVPYLKANTISWECKH